MRTLVGVDIGTSSIKLSALEGDGKKVRPIAEGIAPLPSGAVTEGSIEDPGSVSRVLRSVLEAHSLVDAEAVVSFPFSGPVAIFDVDEPPAAGVPFAAWARARAEERTPFNLETVFVFAELAPAAGVGARVVVAKRELVAAYRDAVLDAGGRVVAVEPDLLALVRYHRAAHPEEKEGVSLLDMGASYPKMVIVEAGRLLLTNGFLRSPEEYVSDLPLAIEGRLAARLGRGLARMRLCGGASPMSGVAKALHDRLRIPVETLGPGLMPFPEGPLFAVSRGLALRLLVSGVEAVGEG